MIRVASMAIGLAATVIAAFATPIRAQLPDYPLAPLRPSGDLVAPYFDGWYANTDGSFTLSFGFLNRNTRENVYIPLGPNNFVEPEEFDGVQPEYFPAVFRGGFEGRRERGAFAIRVPASFANRDVVWTLTHAGQSYSIPGRVTSPAYELSRAPYSAGSLPPEARFREGGPVSTGREGIYSDPETVSVGVALPVSLWVRDRGERENNRLYPVEVTWQRHQGPGPVDFGTVELVEESDGWAKLEMMVTFSEPGEYVLRARIDNFRAPDSGFDYNCCWSNAYVPVAVIR